MKVLGYRINVLTGGKSYIVDTSDFIVLGRIQPPGPYKVRYLEFKVAGKVMSGDYSNGIGKVIVDDTYSYNLDRQISDNEWRAVAGLGLLPRTEFLVSIVFSVKFELYRVVIEGIPIARIR